MKIFETGRDCTADIVSALTTESHGPDPELQKTVSRIIDDVRQRGDAALLEMGRRFDSPDLQGIRVGEDEFDAANDGVKPT